MIEKFRMLPTFCLVDSDGPLSTEEIVCKCQHAIETIWEVLFLL